MLKRELLYRPVGCGFAGSGGLKQYLVACCLSINRVVEIRRVLRFEGLQNFIFRQRAVAVIER